MPRISQLPLPAVGATASTPVKVGGDGVWVVVGANGAGKSRLGHWIEMRSSLNQKAQRITAQKSLIMPPSVQTKAVSKARADLVYGHPDATGINYKEGHRYPSGTGIGPLSDFDKLMIYLFSEENEQSVEYRRSSLESAARLEPPGTKLDIVKALWELVLPERELLIGGGEVMTRPRAGGEQYPGGDMSDGERVVFYLIGEALSSPADGVLIVDEPELHLHKSIQAPLWDAIEGARQDLGFVYLTHDLEFAASRANAPKICLRRFDGANWDWYVAPEDSGLSEEILLQILGARKPVLFVEGDDTSLDYFFLRHVYSNMNVVPAGSCDHVIHAVATFRGFEGLHHLKCMGLVDRDQRDAAAIEYLTNRNVHVLSVAEIENVVLSESVLRVVAKVLAWEDPDAIVARVKDLVLARLSAERERIVSESAAARIERGMRSFDAKARGKEALVAAVSALAHAIDGAVAYDAAEAEINEILANCDYGRALAVYSNKGLLAQASPLFGLQSKAYIELLKRLIQKDDDGDLLKVLRAELPTITV